MQGTSGTQGSTPPPSPSLRILLVDDDADGAELVARFLRREGHHVDVAANADQAMASLERLQPELAIIDIGLPGMDGYELAARVRERSDCKLIALSGYSATSARGDTAVTAFDSHLLKPVNLALLLKSIESLQARVRPRP